MNTGISIRFDFPLDPSAAFDALLDELSLALETDGFVLAPGPTGNLSDLTGNVADVVAWEVGRRFALRWRQAGLSSPQNSGIELRLEPIDAGTRVTLTLPPDAAPDDPVDQSAWLARQILAPLVRGTAPGRLEDWVTDRRARRPAGAVARATYGDPLYHYPNFRVILAELRLTADDHLIEIGCGGGVLLRDALRSGCRAAGIDHSPDMVRLARQVNAQAIDQGRAVIETADAAKVPFPDDTFTCATMTGLLGFLPDPVAAFRELARVLCPGGRLVALGSDPALKGTPAAPEPIASRLRFYDDGQLKQLALDGGFAEATVVRRDLLPFAREAGVPEEHLPLFAHQPAPFLRAIKR